MRDHRINNDMNEYIFNIFLKKINTEILIRNHLA